jgi:hypothetical protein
LMLNKQNIGLPFCNYNRTADLGQVTNKPYHVRLERCLHVNRFQWLSSYMYNFVNNSWKSHVVRYRFIYYSHSCLMLNKQNIGLPFCNYNRGGIICVLRGGKNVKSVQMLNTKCWQYLIRSFGSGDLKPKEN